MEGTEKDSRIGFNLVLTYKHSNFYNTSQISLNWNTIFFPKKKWKELKKIREFGIGEQVSA